MRWIPDDTGRLRRRPFYEDRELDSLCEKVVVDFLIGKYGEVRFPISTNDLTILVEHYSSSLDLYADLKAEGVEIQGMTVFLESGSPKVLISGQLSKQHWRENRLRTTLTHELGHVLLHDKLWARGQLSFLEEEIQPRNPRCGRSTIFGVGMVDWMEWQAGFASGSLLMPYSYLRKVVQSFRSGAHGLENIPVNSKAGQLLVAMAQERFSVSVDAARVRLLQADFLIGKSSQLELPNRPARQT